MENTQPSPDVPARLEQLRVTTGWSWDEIAARLEISRAMVYHAKSGERRFSPKVEYRLGLLEKQAGRESNARKLIDQGLTGRRLIDALLSGASRQTPVEAQDVDRGYVELALTYRRGSPPRGYQGQRP